MKWLALILLTLTACQKSERKPLTHETYVWQTPARPEVQDAIRRASTHSLTLHVRAAEMRWDGKRFITEETLTKLPAPRCGLVVRIGASASALEWTPEQVGPVVAVFQKLAALGPQEIQCDFDCPQKRLGSYLRLLNALQAAVGKIPVIPTTLPAWLDEPAFQKLIAGREGYALQVHSLQLPKRAGDPVVIFDPRTARTAAEKASALKVPFRIAMATYGCEVRFGNDGKVTDVISEDLGSSTGAQRAFALADPTESASLIREWTRNPPAGMQGIIWYRLPVAGDQRNWPWETFERVIRGESDSSAPELDISNGAGARDLFIVNRSNFPVRLPEEILIQHPTLAADGAGAYHLESQGETLRLIRRAEIWPWLDPGKKIPSGWLRFRDEPERIVSHFK